MHLELGATGDEAAALLNTHLPHERLSGLKKRALLISNDAPTSVPSIHQLELPPPEDLPKESPPASPESSLIISYQLVNTPAIRKLTTFLNTLKMPVSWDAKSPKDNRFSWNAARLPLGNTPPKEVINIIDQLNAIEGVLVGLDKWAPHAMSITLKTARFSPTRELCYIRAGLKNGNKRLLIFPIDQNNFRFSYIHFCEDAGAVGRITSVQHQGLTACTEIINRAARENKKPQPIESFRTNKKVFQILRISPRGWNVPESFNSPPATSLPPYVIGGLTHDISKDGFLAIMSIFGTSSTTNWDTTTVSLQRSPLNHYHCIVHDSAPHPLPNSPVHALISTLPTLPSFYNTNSGHVVFVRKYDHYTKNYFTPIRHLLTPTSSTPPPP